MASTSNKTCSDCGIEKPLTAFNQNQRQPDGKQDRCRQCFSAYNKRRYEADPDRFKQAVKSYKEGNPEAVFISRLRVWRENRNRHTTYKLVEAALAAGILHKPDACPNCGIAASELSGYGLHKHHFDYNNPLSVAWLCPACHRQMHEAFKKRERVRENNYASVEEALESLTSPELSKILGLSTDACWRRKTGERRLNKRDRSALENFIRSVEAA